MNRQTECKNLALQQYLRNFVNYLQDDGVHWLPLAEFAYNNSVHASTSVTQFFAKIGFYRSIEAIIWAISAH
jgi:hypothetical protein